jgi:hypothetical protein
LLQKGSGTPSTFIFIYSYQNKNPPKQVQAVNQHLMPHSINKKKPFLMVGGDGWTQYQLAVQQQGFNN